MYNRRVHDDSMGDLKQNKLSTLWIRNRNPSLTATYRSWTSIWNSSNANWQGVCVALAAVRAHPTIGLSILPLIRAITLLAVDDEMQVFEGVLETAVPNVHLGRFTQTQYALNQLNDRQASAPKRKRVNG
jgi:hypothetical protein